MHYRAGSLILGFIALLAPQLLAADMPKTKTVSYRGGIVTFSIPSSWREEHESGGGAAFYEDRPDSGTLRLNVLSFDSSEPAMQMALTAFPAGTYELLSNGFPMRYIVKESAEGDENLRIHTWSVAVPVPPNSLRIVMFHHTVLAGQESDPLIKGELDFLANSINSASFSQVPGVSGDYPQ